MAEPILTVEHLIKAYGETPVLDDISFAVKPGEVIVVVGPSGCGKSTLLRCLNGLPNRDRVDAMMARLEKQGLLPSHFTCMCFQFTSLNHLSREYGYSVGNHVLRDFAGLVAALGTEESFIGSNGAGQIMGFFRECNAVKAEAILEVLDEQIQEYNSLNPDYAIEYKAASATSDDEKEFNIRDLLRCAFKKLRDANKPQPETAHETV